MKELIEQTDREAFIAWVKENFGERVDTRLALNGDGNDWMSWDMECMWRVWKHLTTPPAASEPVSKGYTLPDGMVTMPRKLTAENGAKHALSGEFFVETREECHECGGRGCEDCGEEGSLEVRLAIDWTTIKEIYSKTVEHFEAAPAPGGDAE